MQLDNIRTTKGMRRNTCKVRHAGSVRVERGSNVDRRNYVVQVCVHGLEGVNRLLVVCVFGDGSKGCGLSGASGIVNLVPWVMIRDLSRSATRNESVLSPHVLASGQIRTASPRRLPSRKYPL